MTEELKLKDGGFYLTSGAAIMTTPDTAATQAQIAMLEALKERVERGETGFHIEVAIIQAFDVCLGLNLVSTESADAFERAVYPVEVVRQVGEYRRAEWITGGVCYTRGSASIRSAHSLPAAKVAWVIARRIAELREREVKS